MTTTRNDAPSPGAAAATLDARPFPRVVTTKVEFLNRTPEIEALDAAMAHYREIDESEPEDSFKGDRARGVLDGLEAARKRLAAPASALPGAEAGETLTIDVMARRLRGFYGDPDSFAEAEDALSTALTGERQNPGRAAKVAAILARLARPDAPAGPGLAGAVRADKWGSIKMMRAWPADPRRAETPPDPTALSRALAMHDALPEEHRPPDNTPLRNCLPGIWPTVGDLRAALALVKDSTRDR